MHQPPIDHTKPRSGAVMILVLAVLVILALLGVVFVSNQTVQKRIAGNFADEIRAKMLAQSGLEAGMEELRKGLGEPGGPSASSQPMIYYGTQIN